MHPAVYGQLLRLPVACGQGELCLGTWSPFTSSSWPLRSLLFLCSRELDAGWCLMHLVKGQRNAFARDVGTCGLLTQASLGLFFADFWHFFLPTRPLQSLSNGDRMDVRSRRRQRRMKRREEVARTAHACPDWHTIPPHSTHTQTHVRSFKHTRMQALSVQAANNNKLS